MILPSNDKLVKKARRKFLANGIKGKLSEIKDSSLLPSYRKSFFCSKTLIQTDNRLTSLYCGQRWCPTCTAIKTAKFIDAYKHELDQYDDYYFVTLTIKSDKIYADDLKAKIGEMLLAWKRINANARDKKRTGNMEIWHGMRKVECTYRNNGTFHPHFHILVRGLDVAKWVVGEWLKHFPTSLEKGQDISKATPGVHNELFKYYTKLISGSGKKGSKKIDAVALDKVLLAMVGRRVFHPFGTFKKKIDESDMPSLESQEFDIKPVENAFWQWYKHDWIDLETGELLSGYKPTEGFQEMLYPDGIPLSFQKGKKSNHA